MKQFIPWPKSRHAIFSLSQVVFCWTVFYFSGIGSFTIVDGQKVTGEDIGNKYVHSNKVEHNLVTHNIMMHSVDFLQQFSLS